MIADIPLKTLFGIVGILLSVASYIPYIALTVRRRTRPHAFTWLVWSALAAIAFTAQLSAGAGIGAWVSGITVLGSGTIFVLGILWGEKEFTRSDKMSLAGAALALATWFALDDPLWSVVAVLAVDAFGFWPTLRKSLRKPWEESALGFGLSGMKYLVALFALETYTVTTWLYPAWIALETGGFALLLIALRARERSAGSAAQAIATAVPN